MVVSQTRVTGHWPLAQALPGVVKHGFHRVSLGVLFRIMLILHASVSADQLLLWGETAEQSVEKASRLSSSSGTQKRADRATGPEDSATVQRARFAADVQMLLAAVTAELPECRPTPEKKRTWFAWLPSNSSGALPSSPLLEELHQSPTRVRLAPWSVPVLPLTSTQAVEVLVACTGRSTWGPGIVVGPTLEYWAEVLRWAGSLLVRQKYIPGMTQDAAGESFRACWEPVLTGEDRLRAEQLSRQMPDACRALGLDVARPPEPPPALVLSSTLGMLLDRLVRVSLGTAAISKAPKRSAGIHDRWLHALKTQDGRISGDHEELAELSEQVSRWRRPLELAASAPFRLCFRLDEPVGKDLDRWQLHYLLQAVDEPDLLIPAEAAWTGEGENAARLARDGFRPREYLLSALGQAASICPRIEASLASKIPVGFEMNATAAHEFLTQRAGTLEQAGFGMFLPPWWSRRGTSLRLSAKAVVNAPKNTGRSGLSLDELLSFHWQVSLGDHLITLDELKALAKLKTPLVQVRGQWVELDPAEIQAAISFWKSKGDSQISARDAVQMALGVARPPGKLDFAGVEAGGWLADLLEQLEGATGFESLPPPGGFHGELRPYQERGYAWLDFLRRWGLGACLADDMGLGKTVQTLALVQHIWESTPERERTPALLICPMSVVGNWKKEAARFTPDLPVMIHHGLERARDAEFRERAVGHAVVLTSYALLHRDFKQFSQIPWSSMILDEAQNIKNPQTKQAQAARSLRVAHRIALTGTPMENHVGDLWSIMEFLNPGWLGTHAEFKRTFQIPIQAQRDQVISQQLRRLTAPFILRRVKTDKTIIADLPDKLETKVFCTLTPEQASLYSALVNRTAQLIESTSGIQRKGIVLATLMKLKQVCNHPAHFLRDHSKLEGRSGKLSRLTEMLEEALSAGDRALVFSQFAEMGHLLKSHLQETFGREILFLHGGTSKSDRDRMVDQFQSPAANAPPVFILSLKAGGTGLNLTAANHVFHFDRWWNPAVENQATDRAFRIGQTRRVQVHKLVCAGTLEERIDAMIEEKTEIAGSVVDSSEAWLTKLSNEELKSLFALREEALAG